MGVKSLKTIFKAIGKEASEEVSKNIGKIDKVVNSATKVAHGTTDKAVRLGGYIKDKGFKAIPESELAETLSPARHLFKTKAKTSTNLLAFGALTAYGIGSGFDKEGAFSGGRKLGTIESGYGYDMINEEPSITTQKYNESMKDEALMQDRMDKEMKSYGSAGPDIVFALHQLRNR